MLMLRCASLLALAAGVIAPLHAADISASLDVAGTRRTYGLHIPAGPAPQGGFPIVLAFHGGGTQAPWMRRLTDLDTVSETRRFIVVYPNGIDRHWNDGRSTITNPQDDVGFVSALLDRLENTYPVARGRIYATGISNGALFAERLGCDLAGRIAAIAPVAGTLPTDIAAGCRPAKPISVLQIDGTADPIMPFDGGSVATPGGKGEGGEVLSVARTLSVWARRNGCSGSPDVMSLPPQRAFDPTRVSRTRYTNCERGNKVTLLTVDGGGHTWPGGNPYAPAMIVGKTSRQFSASEVIVDFFLTLPTRE